MPRCKIYLDAEVGEASADLISTFLAEGALGSLEGEARVRAESYEKTIRFAHETLKELELDRYWCGCVIVFVSAHFPDNKPEESLSL